MAAPSGQGVTLSAAFAGVRRVPQPVNEPNHTYAPGTPAARRAEGAPQVDGGREDRHPADHRRARDPHRQRTETVGDAARSRARARPSTTSPVPSTSSRRSPPRPPRAASGPRGRGKTAPPCCCAPPSCSRRRGARRSTPRRCSGSRRRRSRRRSTPPREMIDFWRFNTYFAQELYSEQPISSPGVWNSDGVPQPRGLRLRRLAVQLHRDRRQPDDRAGADGQHRDLEAGVDARC